MPKKTEKRVNHNHYDRFVKQAWGAGFVDTQADFLWDWICIGLLNKQAFLHKDNYSAPSQGKGKKKATKQAEK